MFEGLWDSTYVFTQRDDGIYEVLFKDVSRSTMNLFWEEMEAAFQAAAPEDTIPFLIDWRESGMPPLRYLSQRAKGLLRRFPNGPRARLAFLHNPGTMVTLAQTMISLLGSDDNNARRFFAADQYDSAVVWLSER